MNAKASDNVIVLRNILNDPVLSSFIAYAEGGDKYFAEFAGNLFKSGAECNFLNYLQNLVLYDENAFSLCCANSKTPSSFLKTAYINDLDFLFTLAKQTDSRGLYRVGEAAFPFDENDFGKTAENLQSYYGRFGYGKFIGNSAFVFENNELVPVNNPSTVKLEDLKNYEYEKKLIASNLENFLHGLPFSDMLLYGDRGTGKSSTVHAMLNKYFGEGLRVVELNKENMLQLPKIRNILLGNPLKFVIFIDDLALEEGDEKISTLKAYLEGSLSSSSPNIMIAATSNRRHIIKESFSDRQNSVHVNDSMQEQLSLSDRFGLTVMFSSTDKAQYLSIVKQLAADKNLKCGEEQLCAVAERWALSKGGRSPRRAKQIVDLICSSEAKGIPVDF